MDILKMVARAQAKRASDLHLSVFSPPLIRVDGQLETMDGDKELTTFEVEEALGALASVDEVARFRRELELDFSYSLPNGTRLRCSVAQQRGEISMAVRILSSEIVTIDGLELPPIFKKFAVMEKGLIVVSGPTGSGKTTTQAALIHYINTHQTKHILTIEDPIEYSFANIKSKITQRELGGDTLSVAQALKHAMRHDPDVILVGEMRDTETAAAVISLAETGHLVITTSHGPYAAQTVERVVDLFPTDQRYLAQMRLASLLSVVICQTLVPRADGTGRIAAVEIMILNSAIRNLIREGKLTLIANAVRDYREEGNITLDESLVSLYRQRIITLETVKTYCHNPDDVSRLLTETSVKVKTLSNSLNLSKK